MKLKRRFYDASINFKNMSLKQLLIGVVLGLASAFFIYSFFYVIRETFRVMSFGFVGFEQNPNILSESDRNFYNLFFAALSSVFGNSITILFVFSKPNKILSRLNPKRKRLVNDQIFLSFNFMYWFTKIGLTFGVFSMCCMGFDFFPYFKPLSYLFVFILFLESWKNLSLVFKKNRLKIQLINLLVLIMVALGLSLLDIVNYKAIDKLSLKNNPIIDLPYSNFYNEDEGGYGLYIDLKLQLDEKGNLEIFTEDKRKIDLNSVASIVLEKRASVREELIPYLKAHIMANRNIPVKYVKMIEAEFYAINQSRVVYKIYNLDLFTNIFIEKGIQKRIDNSVLEYKINSAVNKWIKMPPKPPVLLKKYHFKDTLNISVSKQIKINDMLVPETNLTAFFLRHINQETLFLYHLNEEASYQDYIKVLSFHLNAVNILRQQNQIIFIEDSYGNNPQYRKEQAILNEKYPIFIKEKRTSI